MPTVREPIKPAAKRGARAAPSHDKPERPHSQGHGIKLDDKGQEQPADKARALQTSRKDKGGDPPGEKSR